jgi:glycosyltransferase involved in cell wall biosynthesis
MMRIGVDTQSTLGRKTGIGLYTANLLRALHRVAPQHEYVELSWGGTEELRTDQRLRWQQYGLPRRARTADVDLLHVTGFDAPLWKPRPVVLTVHDLIGLLFPANLPPVSRFYWSRWLPRTIRWADRIIAVSEHTRTDLNRVLGIPPQRIKVIHNGVDEEFQPLQNPNALETVRQRYRLPTALILYLGTLEPRKGVGTLIAAYGTLAEEIPHDLVIAGKRGWYTAPLFRQVETLGLGQRVHFTGYIPEDDLPALYNLAQLFVYPSRYEGFGLPVLEAMACGLPVICTNAASLPEIVGDAALLVPPDDAEALAAAMRRTLNDIVLEAEMVARGLELARRFTWEKTAQKTVQAYEETG